MTIEEALHEQCVVSDLKGTSKGEIITELVKSLGDAHLVQDTEKAVAVVLEREKLGSTGIGDGVAIPHGKLRASIQSAALSEGRRTAWISMQWITNPSTYSSSSSRPRIRRASTSKCCPASQRY
jgi:mannitol/fructose-specific phosphotransferase system IIA component (Ntr-type)